MHNLVIEIHIHVQYVRPQQRSWL